MPHSTPCEFQILRADRDAEREKWLTAWQSWPQREVFGHPSYVELFTDEESRAACAYYATSTGSVLYPFLWRSIPGTPATDITSAYGYGGPGVWPSQDNSQIMSAFWRHVEQWALEIGIVSEFVRFNPVQQNLSYPGSLSQKLLNVIRSLDLDEEQLWYDVKHKVRKNVNRARQSNVEIEIDTKGQRLEEFLKIYHSTMDRRSTGSEYYFKSSFYEQIIDTLPEQFAFFHALHKGKVISTELVLVSEETVYSFLGGTDESSFDLRPNDLLKYEVMLWAKSIGKGRYVLGGGKSIEDGIFKYKEAFAPSGVVPFYVGTRVLDSDAYQNLAERSGAELNASIDFFPLYRAA